MIFSAGMQVAGRLAVPRTGKRLVAEVDALDADVLHHLARQAHRAFSVMVADHPDQPAARRERCQPFGVALGHARFALAVVEAVAQEDDDRGIQALDLGGQAAQRVGSVVGRQHLTLRA